MTKQIKANPQLIVDPALVTELTLYVTNHGDIYRSTEQLRKNFARKIARIEFSATLAIAYLERTFVKDWLKAYEKEFCNPGWYRQASKASREAIADEVLTHWMEEMFDMSENIKSGKLDKRGNARA